ncbi:MAG: type II toxin-antitoxin system Phd/YefM family antitoxin [Synergistaceae bacterium]|nr:type II toxin-antitoxin system Phd/YefM family antitoxin [Synergistaceae bacterium]MBQ3345649.1 type II toxin-antitoxin system Phd/YefM family antitoxin [Synergistaceae bacterium]MBQ3398479.1 type II toxin-antitoxin system Phd/YefM family antitoxin [Synergistaceae bacterium]MBQ3759345.1 type II toxin-antitoxin system Phd/YefM family antitoxin [Synergistaceae bacterium]MBQ4400639.1 type II toxin-antitoxin system Phd/YefM family antitoxin [Synergistaceae bacterium]
MQNITLAGFQKNMLSMIEQTIKYNEPVNVVTDSGNVILLSDEDYSGMLETINLLSIPGMREKLIDGITEPISDCIPEEKIEW